MRPTRRPWTPEDDELVKAFSSLGWDDLRIGQALKRNRIVVMRHRHNLDMPRAPHPAKKSAFCACLSK